MHPTLQNPLETAKANAAVRDALRGEENAFTIFFTTQEAVLQSTIASLLHQTSGSPAPADTIETIRQTLKPTASQTLAEMVNAANAALETKQPEDPLLAIRKISAPITLYSWDVFDTCLMRRVAHPTTVFALLESFLTQENHPIAEGFAHHRLLAEKKCRETAAQQGRKDVTLTMIYAELATFYPDHSPQQVAALQVKECELEEKLIFRHPRATQCLQTLAAEGRPNIFCSEMYLPSSLLRQWLPASAASTILTSGELGQSKGDGSLYRELLSRTGLPPACILHIGDNPETDLASASREGLQTMLWTKHFRPLPYAEQSCPPPPDSLPFSLSNLTEDALSALALGLAREHRFQHASFFERIGFEITGPACLAFLNWLLPIARQENIDKLFFLERDGFFPARGLAKMRQIWPHQLPEASLLPSSRRLFGLAAICDIEAADWDFLLKPAPGMCVGDFFQRVGMSTNEMAESLSKHQLPPVETVICDAFGYTLPRHRDSLYHVFVEHIDAFHAHRQQHQTSVLDYLKAHGPQNARHSIVDIGWEASSARHLSRLARLAGNQPPTAFYFATWENARRHTANTGPLHSFLAHFGNPAGWVHLLQESVALMEFFFSAPFGSAESVHRQPDGSWQIRRAPSEPGQTERLQALLRGFDLFMERALPLFPGPAAQHSGQSYLALALHRLLRFPDSADLAHLAPISHREAWGCGSFQPLVESPPAKPNLQQPPPPAYHQSAWKRAWLRQIALNLKPLPTATL